MFKCSVFEYDELNAMCNCSDIPNSLFAYMRYHTHDN